MEFRVCRLCNNKKELSKEFFYKRGDGFRWECKTCTLQSRKTFYPKIKEDRSVYIKKYYQKNKEACKKQQKSYQLENKDQISLYRKEYFQENKKEIIAANHIAAKARRKIDPVFRLRRDISTRIYTELKKSNGSKNNSSMLKYFTFDMQELKQHLENQFEPWMTWNNQGKYDSKTWDDNNSSSWTWNLDHIIPQSKLPYTSMTDDNFQKCWSLENLRPLSAKQNVIDGNRR